MPENQTTPTKKLTAIMFTDIAGFTALSAKDEKSAFELIEKQRELLKPIVNRHAGQWLREIGDGLLLSFSSSTEAVKCAIEIQKASKDVENLNIRIGIHQGDIIQKDGDLFGDDVNIASRIESFAAVGGVAISDKVNRDISSNSEITTKYVGEPKLKGVKQEVKVYCIISHGLPETKLSEVSAKLEKTSTPWIRYAVPSLLILAVGSYFLTGTEKAISSIAVLPLANMSGDPEQDYFAIGMTEELITELSKISALKVTSRQSVMRFKGSELSMSEIASQLGVDAILEGSVFRVGDSVRITTQLIHGATDEHLWADRFDRELKNILIMHSEVARAVAKEIKITVTPQEETLLANARQVNPETYEAYLKGMFYLDKSDPAEFNKGLMYLNEAIEKNPGDPLAYTGLAQGYINIGHGPAPPPGVWLKAEAATLTALKLDSNLAEAHAALARVKLYYERDWPGAEREFKRTIELDQSLAKNRYHYAWFLYLTGRMEKALIEHTLAKELDPLNPLYTAWLGGLYLRDGQYERAMEEARKSLELNPYFGIGLLVLGNAYLEMGIYEEAIATHEKMVSVAPFWKFALGVTYARTGDISGAKKILAELKEAEATPWGAYILISLNAALGNLDEAFKWLDYEQPHAFIPWVAVGPEFEPLRGDPRFKEFLQRMNL